MENTLTTDTPIYTPQQRDSNAELNRTQEVSVKEATQSQLKIISRKKFLCRVYCLTAISIVLASTQWLLAAYVLPARPKPLMAFLIAFVLFITSIDLLVLFVVFKQMLYGTCYIWLLLLLTEECLVLCVLVCTHITWPYVVSSLGAFVICIIVGIYSPAILWPNVFILLLCAIFTIIAAIIAMVLDIGLHIYAAVCIAIMVFMPWTIYNSQNVHGVRRSVIRRRDHIYCALIFFLNYTCLVAFSYFCVDSVEYLLKLAKVI